MTTVNQLIEQIKALPNTEAQLKLDNSGSGLGTLTIYQTISNGLRVQSIWIGRRFSEEKLQKYLAERGAA